MDVEVLAIIPARGGSRSIPGKNIRPFGSHPLLAYSIAAGQQAQSVSRVIVSTDDEAIAEVAKRYRAEVPFLRPKALAQDDTLDLPVFQHALQWLEREQGYRPEAVVQLRPTSPLRPPDCVDAAVRILLEHPQSDSVRGVVPSGQNPYKMWRLEGERLQPLLDSPAGAYNMPRQKLPPTYWQTGHVDAIRAGTILDKGSMSGEVILPLMLDPRYTVDIDNLNDWARAERLLNELDVVRPGRTPRRLPKLVRLLALDFDGVLTDDRVWVSEEGLESVAAHRGDGFGIGRLKEHGVEVVVISLESNPVVAARCRKLGITSYQGITDKAGQLQSVLRERSVPAESTVYIGNDVNDLPCFPLVGFAAAVADARPEVRAAADLCLSRPGGQGAVREMCDLIIARLSGKDANGQGD
jgi:N-acylneuraminate cytidylyltransferase